MKIIHRNFAVIIRLMMISLLMWSSAFSVLAQSSKSANRQWAKEPPIRLDFDMEAIAEPKQVETGYLFDFADGTFFQQVKQGFDVPRQLRAIARRPKEAINVNTFDEVPDSSWFTNRNGRRPMTIEEIKRGPDVTAGPAPGEVVVVRGKTSGITPGFTIRDSRGDLYLLKFDPPQYPELSTGAEVISTKLFHAIGYHVPQNTLYWFQRAQLKLDAKAKFTDSEGQKRVMTEADIDALLSKAARQSDGQYRCLASRLLSGKPKGGFTFLGVRDDDPNDIIPHEHRRDLRALRVFCAWLEHNDIRVGNSLDMFVAEKDRAFLRHYLIDFGSTLGSDTIFPNLPGVGHEYQIDFTEGAKSFFSLGIYQRPWQRKNYDPVVSPAVGIYSAKHFHPRKWKPNFPLVAFENMTERDAKWAAEIVSSFTDEQLQAVVELAQYTRASDAQHILRTLIARRDKIAAAYLRQGTGMGQVKLEKTGDVWQVAFTDYFDGDAARPGFEYELRQVSRAAKAIAKGTFSASRMTLDAAMIKLIQQCSAHDADRGVAQLVLRRPGASAESHIFLYADSKGDLQIAGLWL